MPAVVFARFPYYPSLQCSDAEHLGYTKLSDPTKDALLPIFEISQRRSISTIDDAIELIRKSTAGRPFALDLCKDPAPPAFVPRTGPNQKSQDEQRSADEYNKALATLLDPVDGFSHWRAVIDKFPNSVPLLQFSDAKTQARALLRQAALLSAGGGSIAIRISPETDAAIYPAIGNILSILDTDRLLVILDCGQSRRSITKRQAFAETAIGLLQQEVAVSERPLLQIVCMTSSFPQSPEDDLTVVEGSEWKLWETVRDIAPISFGDYSAMYRRKKKDTFVPPDWRPTVTYPLDDSWIIYRHLNAKDEHGWVSGSQQILKHKQYPPAPAVWGNEILVRAATGDIAGINSSRYWHAAKVNLHLHRQLEVATLKVASFGSDDEGDDDDLI